ncbi:hypothetical protein BGX33_000238, partial [Mortierella sp. NVP41]
YEESFGWAQGNTEENDGDSGDSDALARMQELLINLKTLMMMWDIGETTVTDDILLVFARCPNIKELGIHSSKETGGLATSESTLARRVPRFRHSGTFSYDSAMVGTLPFRIIDALSPQQFEQFACYGFSPSSSNPASILALRRHSRALRKVVLNPSSLPAKFPISVVFEECANLE